MKIQIQKLDILSKFKQKPFNVGIVSDIIKQKSSPIKKSETSNLGINFLKNIQNIQQKENLKNIAKIKERLEDIKTLQKIYNKPNITNTAYIEPPVAQTENKSSFNPRDKNNPYEKYLNLTKDKS